MSKISTVYDAFVTRIEAMLPDHLQLSDPYLFVKNTDSEKRQGYGLRLGGGEHTGNNVSCDIILSQSMTLILSRMVQGRETARDKKAETEKQLMEDLFLVMKDIEKEPTMGQPTVVLSGEYQSHGGIQFVEDERDRFMRVEAEFRFRYREDLN